MTKKEACELLGVTERTLDKYAREGHLTVVQVRGKTGLRNDYDQADLERFKAELEAPQIAPQRPVAPLYGAGEGEGTQTGAIIPFRDSAPLVNSSPLFVLSPEQLPALAQAFAGQGANVVPIADKLVLSLEEAAMFSGFSVGRLRAAIAEDKLVARKVGRAWKMRRGDLTAFVDSIFEDGQ